VPLWLKQIRHDLVDFEIVEVAKSKDAAAWHEAEAASGKQSS
jgi:hypothetical protein